MTNWKSKINTGPLEDEEGYAEWVFEVMEEPWVHALWGMVQHNGTWVGTEEQLIEEMKTRVGKRVAESEDFPSSFERLLRYQAYAIDGFNYSRLGVFDYHRELADGDLDDFYVPGWGPEAPVLVKEGDACYRPYYREAQFELLKYWHPLPVAVLHLTASREFDESRTKRNYTTKELAKLLVKYEPTYRNVPRLTLDMARPEWEDDLCPRYKNDWEFHTMGEPYGREGYVYFHKQLKRWAPILKEEGIGVSWEKRRNAPGLPESDDPEKPLRTWWTIEAPPWQNPDRFRGAYAIFSDDE